MSGALERNCQKSRYLKMRIERRKTTPAQHRIFFDSKRRLGVQFPEAPSLFADKNIDKIHLTAGRYLLVTSYRCTPAYFGLSYNCNHLVSCLISDFKCAIFQTDFSPIISNQLIFVRLWKCDKKGFSLALFPWP